MIRINETPYRTSKNYGINDVEIDEKVLDKQIVKFSGFEAKNAHGIKILSKTNTKSEKIIAKELSKQLENASLKRKIVVETNTQKPIVLCYDFEKEKTLSQVVEIEVQEKVRAQIVVRLVGENVYQNGFLKILCRKDSVAEIVLLTDLGSLGENFLTLENVIEENARLDYNLVDFSSKHSIYNFYGKLVGENAVSNLNVVYLAGQDNTLDLNLFQEIFGKNCTATIEAVGTLDDFAKKNFKGTISFVKGCKKSFGSENEFCLLLSDTAKSKALPMLLCHEEDVDGKHSTAVGRADEKELFYVMSRGIDLKDAIKMLVKAKLNVALEKIFDRDLKNEIFDKIDGRLEK